MHPVSPPAPTPGQTPPPPDATAAADAAHAGELRARRPPSVRAEREADAVLYPPQPVALARRVEALPTGPYYAFEPKFDGHRLLIYRTAGAVMLQSRAGHLVTNAFPDVVASAEALPAGTVLDAEVLVWRQGRTDRGAVQQRVSSTPARAAALAVTQPAAVAAFDVLCQDGDDLRARPYTERRTALVDLVGLLGGPPIQYALATRNPEEAAEWFEALREHTEGLVCKRLTSAYRPNRRDWLKYKHPR